MCECGNVIDERYVYMYSGGEYKSVGTFRV